MRPLNQLEAIRLGQNSVLHHLVVLIDGQSFRDRAHNKSLLSLAKSTPEWGHHYWCPRLLVSTIIGVGSFSLKKEPTPIILELVVGNTAPLPTRPAGRQP